MWQVGSTAGGHSIAAQAVLRLQPSASAQRVGGQRAIGAPGSGGRWPTHVLGTHIHLQEWPAVPSERCQVGVRSRPSFVALVAPWAPRGYGPVGHAMEAGSRLLANQ
jgi:hypothetical protein